MHLHRTRRHRPILTGLPVVLVGALLATVPPAGSAPTTGPTVDRQEETGRLGYIAAPAGRPIDVGLAPGATADQVATAFLQRNARPLGLASDDTALRVLEEHPSAAGGRTVRVAQTHAGIPVLGGEFTVNLDPNRDVLSVLGEASPVGEVATTPSVRAREAARAAVGRVAREAGIDRRRLLAGEPELVFYDPRLLGAPGPFQTARLSWVVDVRSARPAVAHTVVVDATVGGVALSFSTLAHARDRVVCDADNSPTQYPCTTPVWTESDQPGGLDGDVSRAFEYAGDTYDFFQGRFGRDSLDDAGLPLVSTVDYCDRESPCPFANAFWDGSQMVYGNGFAVADDVVGHELAHGVTDFSSSLFYYMQSGAINESMSDIFGELIDLTNGSGTDRPRVRWHVGEDIPGLGPIRDMADPPVHGHPDRMLSPLYQRDAAETDGGGVHTNSGVSNKAAYLLADGGTFNGRAVAPIGLRKTALLFYTVNNDLLVSGSDFADLARAMRQACGDLASAGTGGFSAADCTQVDQALLATEMDLDPTSAPTDVVSACPSGSPAYVLHDDLESDTGQFTTMTISGPEVWSYPQNPNDYVDVDATYATSGDTNIWGDDRAETSDSALRMSTPVMVPPGAFLHFNHAHGFEDGVHFFDGGVLEYSTSGAGGPWVDAGPLFTTGDGAGGYNGTISDEFDNPLAGRSAFVGESYGYGASRADLGALAGRSVMFRWRIGTDFMFQDFGWFIDDVSLVTCDRGTDATPPSTTVTSGPTHGSTVTTPDVAFGFTADEAGSTFQCKLDGGGFTPCTSPTAYAGLADGAHTFSVRATDPAANTDPTPATRSFTVDASDTTTPDTTITKHPRARTSKRTATFAFRSDETGASFLCKLDRQAWHACTSPEKVRVTRGKHRFRVRTVDTSGNVDPTPAGWRWKVKRRR